MPATATMPISEINFEASLDRAQEVMVENGNPGRWLAIGRGEGINEGSLFLGYAFGGRSEDSRNRMAVPEGDAIRLIAPRMTAEEMAKIPDAALIYYHAIVKADDLFGVSNGAHTQPTLDAMSQGFDFEHAVATNPTVKGMYKGEEIDIPLSSFEPDYPNFTPRILGVGDLRSRSASSVGLTVVRKDLITGEPVRTFFTGKLEDLEPGQGWAIQTYDVNDPDDTKRPIPSFDQEPYGFSMKGSALDIAKRIREGIGERTFAAAVVRRIDIARRQFDDEEIINTRAA